MSQVKNYSKRKRATKTSHTSQFRRVWKETYHGIIFNAIIQLFTSFKNNSVSLTQQEKIMTNAKETMEEMWSYVDCELYFEKARERIEILVKQLTNMENASKLFLKALSKIDRFDYGKAIGVGQERFLSFNNETRNVRAYEIEFGKFGMVKYLQYKESEGRVGIIAKMSTTLRALNLTSGEWKFITETASVFAKVSNCEFSFVKDDGGSNFDYGGIWTKKPTLFK